MTNEVIEEHTSDLRDLYRSMMGEEGVKDEVGRLSHSQLVREIEKEVQRLKSEVNIRTVFAQDPCRIVHVCYCTTLCVCIACW